MKIFVSSTYTDLIPYRAAVNEMLMRMKLQFSAMEYFGSRSEEATKVCFDEIDGCDTLIGIYAWRYGWQPAPSEASITEQEFDYAQSKGKMCFCYVVKEEFAWMPQYIDRGDKASRLEAFKKKINKLVRSEFTTPDDLAKQVAADLARELSQAPENSFGGLLRVNWDVFAPDLKLVLATAYAQARHDSDDGVVATRHVIAALAGVPNSGQPVVTAFSNVELPRLHDDLGNPDLVELFAYNRPLSSCVFGSMTRLLPKYSTTQHLLAIELAVDLLKNGHGSSVEKFRQVGVDGTAVAKVEEHIRRIAENTTTLRRGLQELTDAEIIHLAYITGSPLPSGLVGDVLRNTILTQAQQKGLLLYLAGELMRRYPKLVGM